MKTVRWIELRITDDEGQVWGLSAAIEPPLFGTPEKALQDLAIERLVMCFDEWRLDE